MAWPSSPPAHAPRPGGSPFAERPDRPAPEARLLWRAEFDRGVLAVRAAPAGRNDSGGFELARLQRWATLAVGEDGREHLVLSNGWRRIRLDVIEGRLLGSGRVRLHYELSGVSGLEQRLLTLRRLLALWQRGRFVHALFPPLRGLPRRLEALRVADAVADGASYREIATALFGEPVVRAQWNGPSDFLLSRVRRRAAEARRMAAGGYQALLRA
ncbi:DUF2285 domain-containing protein [Sphingosinicella sp. LHD-64]|uniref:DNA -binding domain-containing protein n=1 Tax=Sphingosinicella sp. LHD-64 TaxID=3072139 RepID=UPI00280DB232|nr:DUF2285 domain-containing protein [Sphingosinicella sp. LHD-64]MDQ8757463.1 DUF2285 domain-containing protein [Sphingosinicella sp. LHD-64]